MASKPQLVLAFFEQADSAEVAAAAVVERARRSPGARLEALSVLVKNEFGDVRTHKLGPREALRGIGVGAAAGAVAARASDKLTLAKAAVLGGAAGAMAGALVHKGLCRADVDRISVRLEPGQSAVGAVVPEYDARDVAAQLEELGGDPERLELPEPIESLT